MSLSYLEFDFSEDTEGVGTFDAMASVGPAQLGAVQGEVAQVLGWAFDAFGDERGAVDEGGTWDYDLQAQAEYSVPEAWQFDPAMGLILSHRLAPGEPRHTVTLSLSGSEAFCQAFRDRFLSD